MKPPLRAVTSSHQSSLHHPGDLVNGRYEIKRLLGRGAMGEVYLAIDTARDQQLVALKYLLEPERSNALTRFKSEFSTLAHLHHPHVTAVYDLARDASCGVHFFTTEYVVGLSFDVAAQDAPLLTTLGLFVQTLRALAYLHGQARPLWHFDIKAQNVLVAQVSGATPCSKLIDFGLAATGWSGKKLGTPSYMAPEIVNESSADGRADLYSLGVLLYTALTGNNPFRGNNRNDCYERQLTFTPPAPSQRRPDIPSYVDTIVMRLLEKNPDDRFHTAEAVIAELSRNGPVTYAVETDETLDCYVPSQGPFVGRERELCVLQKMTDYVPTCRSADVAVIDAGVAFTGDRRPATGSAVAWIRGAHGVGKTRLLHEAEKIAQLADCVTCCVTLSRHEDPAAVLQAIEQWSQSPATARWLGIDDAHLLVTDPRMHSVRDLVARIVRQAQWPAAHEHRIVLTSLDDDATLTQLNQVQFPLPLGRGQGEGESPLVTIIPLGAFVIEELSEYIGTLTGLANPPQELVDQLWRYTEGHPFFLTEALRALIRGGLLFDANGRWRSTTFDDLGVNIARLHVPATIEAVVAQAYAQLPSAAQDVLGIISVVGHATPRALVEELYQPSTPSPTGRGRGEGADEAIANETFALLIEHHWLSHDPVAQTYSFRSEARQDSVYQQLGAAMRAQWHDGVAQFFNHNSRLTTHDAFRHRAHGSDPIAAQAARWEWAEYLYAQYRPAEAAEKFAEYLQHHTPADQRPMWEIRYHLGTTQRRMHRYAEAIDTFRIALADMPSHAASRDWTLRLREAWGRAALQLRRCDEAQHQFELCLTMMSADDLHIVRGIQIRNWLAWSLMYAANTSRSLEKVVQIFRETAAAATALPAAQRQQIANNDLGHALMQQGNFLEAYDVLRSEMPWLRDAGHHKEFIRAVGLFMECCRARQQYDEARHAYDDALPRAQHLRDAEPLMHLHTTMGNILVEQGQQERAVEHYAHALDLSARLDDNSRAMALMLNLGLCHRQLQQLRRADSYFCSTVALAEGTRSARGLDELYGCRAHLELAELYREQQRFAEARQHIQSARALADQQPVCRPLMFYIIATTIEIHRDAGDAHAAQALTPELNQLARTPELRTTAEQIEHSLQEDSTAQ